MRAPLTHFIRLTIAVAAVAGCGYHLQGKGTFLSSTIHTIGIPPFDSTVPQRTVSDKVTQEVTKVFISRGGYRVVPQAEGADAVLRATITGFVVTPVSFNASGVATRAQLGITASVTLRDSHEDKLIYERPSFQFTTSIELSSGISDIFDPEQVGIDQIARDFARVLVAEIEEGF